LTLTGLTFDCPIQEWKLIVGLPQLPSFIASG
jgi:hypothetical protein